MEFIFECSHRYLTRSLRSLVRYRCEHSKINSISPRAQVLFSIQLAITKFTLVPRARISSRIKSQPKYEIPKFTQFEIAQAHSWKTKKKWQLSPILDYLMGLWTTRPWIIDIATIWHVSQTALENFSTCFNTYVLLLNSTCFIYVTPQKFHALPTRDFRSPAFGRKHFSRE